MKKILILIMILELNILNAQEVSKIRVFEVLETNLYKSHIIKLDSLKKDDLKNMFKNVTSTQFVNLKEVMVSETDDQIVLYYITTTNSAPSTSWYVRLIAQFKDGKARLLIYDDGNVFIPSAQYTPTWKARSFYVTDNKRAQKRFRIKTMDEWMDNADNFIKTIEDGLKSTPKTDKSNDW